ncbi:MAG: tetratricopeptide repeat protein [Acidobacteriia bacterium]|nr:tetratricopeptide repeat protein [Terriglobia bacterium]
MSRWILALLIACVAPLHADDPQTPPSQPPSKTQPELQKRQKPPATGKEEIPPEEDKALSKEEYSFNPLEAEKWLRVGNYYFKQGKYRAAEDRFHGATKWNDGYGEAWLRLGEVEEKLKDPQAAKEAYTKYLEVAPDAKNAAQIRKKLEKLK